MANVVTDPKDHPDVILPDLSKADPLLTFKKDHIALVYGTKWKQRYLQKVGDDYFPLGAQSDVSHHIWRAYNVANGTDWWTKFYPQANASRPTGPLCDGCHSVNYNIQTKTATEWNVGCEKSHGITCFSCHDVHGTENNADLFKPASVLCLQCHGPNSPNGPRAATIEQHTHQAAGSAGSECVARTLKVIPPAMTETDKIPSSCNSCHTDKTVQWAKDALKHWPQFSPWRVAQ